uniref:Uncharacterized protein n=1 Tax=Brassica oleracea var. oleracea TaxID=109376 RepID=A0A0D3C4N7_BRAOL
MEKVEQFEMSPGEKYLVNYSRPDPSDPDPEMSWGLLGEKPLDLGHDVVDISWSPTEPVLTILLKGHGNDPAKALLLRIPDMVVLIKSDLNGAEVTVVTDNAKLTFNSENARYFSLLKIC